MIKFKLQSAGSSLLVELALLFFMLVPALGFLKVWPLSSAVTAGLTLLSVGVLFGAVLVGKGDSSFRWNLAVILFLGLIAALVLSIVLNSYVYESTWRWYLIALIICVMLLVAAAELKAKSERHFHNKISYYLWLGCFVYGVLSLLEYYGFLAQISSFAEPNGGRLTGIWGQSNLTTTTCWLGLLAGAVVFSRTRSNGWWYGSILVFGWTLACAASRMSWLMAVGLLALFFVSRFSRYRVSETLDIGRSLVHGVCLLVILMLVVPLLNQPLRDAMTSFGLLDQGSAVSLVSRDVFQDSARLSEFSKVFSAVETFSWDQWVFGQGPGNYPVFSYHADMSLPPEGLNQGTWLHSHNLFSMVFVELGLAGLAVLLVFLVCIAFVALSSPMTPPKFFSIGGIGLLFIHSNLEFPLWYLWFLVLFCFLLTNLFTVREFKGDVTWLKPVVGFSGLLMVAALLVNVGYQYLRIIDVAMNPERDKQDYQDLSFLANDSLMGPYAVLRKYRDFAPESTNIDWQLQEVRRMKSWQPRDLVVLREFSLLILKQDMREACDIAKQSAYRYPRSAPIMLDHSFLTDALSPGQIAGLANCIEEGLSPRGETLLSMQQKNETRMPN